MPLFCREVISFVMAHCQKWDSVVCMACSYVVGSPADVVLAAAMKAFIEFVQTAGIQGLSPLLDTDH